MSDETKEPVVVPLHFRDLPDMAAATYARLTMWPPYGDQIAVVVDGDLVRRSDPGTLIVAVRDDAALDDAVVEQQSREAALVALCSPGVDASRMRRVMAERPAVSLRRVADFSLEVLAAAAEGAVRRAVYAAHHARLTQALCSAKRPRAPSAAMPTLATIEHAHVCAARGSCWPQTKVAESLEVPRGTVMRIGERMPVALLEAYVPPPPPPQLRVLIVGASAGAVLTPISEAIRRLGREPLFLSVKEGELPRGPRPPAAPELVVLTERASRERLRGITFRLRREHPAAVLAIAGDRASTDGELCRLGCDLLLDAHPQADALVEPLLELLARRSRERAMIARLTAIERDLEGLVPASLGRPGVSLATVQQEARELALGITGSHAAAALLLDVGRAWVTSDAADERHDATG